jgi:hypothetical protein
MKKARKKYEALIEYTKDGIYELYFFQNGKYNKIVESESPSDLLHYLLDKHKNDVILRIPPVINEIINFEAFEYHKWVESVEKELLNGIEQAITDIIESEESGESNI